MKWLAVMAAWLATGAAVATCAITWGVEGRLTTFFLAVVMSLVVGVAHGTTASEEKHPPALEVQKMRNEGDG